MKEAVSVNPPPPPPPQLIRAKQPGYLDLTAEQVDRLISKDPIDKDYDVETEPFARGKYATVRRCRDRQTGKQYAAKFLRKRRRNADLRPEILHEVAVLEACTYNSRIVNLYKVFETTNEMILLLELAPGGELQMVLDRDEVPSESEVARLMGQILDGLHYLHTINVAHLDIKPQNLVLTADFPICDVKLCDFGISRYLSEGADVREILGTPDYVAPEVLNYEPIDVQTDMWSIGVLMYVLLTGCSPFGGDTKQETFCNISQCKLDFPEDLFQDISEDAIDLMKKLMVKNPRDRLTAKECLGHAWFHRTDSAATTDSTTTTTACGGEEDCAAGTDDCGGGRTHDAATSPPPSGHAGAAVVTVPSAFATEAVDGKKQQQQQQNNNYCLASKSCGNSPAPAMTASRRKSFKDNMESLVRRLERELADGDGVRRPEETTAAAAGERQWRQQKTTCRGGALTRANGAQTMPVGGCRDIAPFTFRRVYVVDEPPPPPPEQQRLVGHRPRAPSTSSTPNSSSADNSSASDCSSDTVSEFSIDSSSDRSSIISLEDSLLDHHHHASSSSSSSSSLWSVGGRSSDLLLQQTRRLGKTSASCVDVWGDTSGTTNVTGKRKWPKECSGAVARAMSQFANGCGAAAAAGDCGRPAAAAARLKVFVDGGEARDKRSVGLELMRERTGNVVVIREIKANGSSRYARCSELKCESVQSRIRKLQVHKGGVQVDEKSPSDTF